MRLPRCKAVTAETIRLRVGGGEGRAPNGQRFSKDGRPSDGVVLGPLVSNISRDIFIPIAASSEWKGFVSQYDLVSAHDIRRMLGVV